MAQGYFPYSNQQQQQQQQQVITNCPINRVAGNYYNNSIELNSLNPSINDSIQFSLWSLTNYLNESMPSFTREYTDKCGGYNTHRRCDTNNIRSFKFSNTNGREHRFLNKYKFTQIKIISGEYYLSIDIAKYVSLRGGDLTAFNTKCGDTFSQINILSLKTERLKFQKRNCKNKHKHEWESCKKKYNKSRKTTSKTTSKTTCEIPTPLAQAHIRSPLEIPLQIPLQNTSPQSHAIQTILQ